MNMVKEVCHKDARYKQERLSLHIRWNPTWNFIHSEVGHR